MVIEYIRDRVPITKEEYDKNIYTRKDSSLKEIIKECISESIFTKEPIYKEPGIKSIMDNEIIGYNYFKLSEPRGCLLCSEKEYDIINKMVLDYIRNGNI